MDPDEPPEVREFPRDFHTKKPFRLAVGREEVPSEAPEMLHHHICTDAVERGWESSLPGGVRGIGKAGPVPHTVLISFFNNYLKFMQIPLIYI